MGVGARGRWWLCLDWRKDVGHKELNGDSSSRWETAKLIVFWLLTLVASTGGRTVGGRQGGRETSCCLFEFGNHVNALNLF